jgi:hypothetical protein
MSSQTDFIALLEIGVFLYMQNTKIYIWQPEINYKKVRGEGAKFNF